MKIDEKQRQKPMTIGEKQRLFTRLLPRLFDFIHEHGFECTLGDGYRDPRVFGEVGTKAGYGSRVSCHKSRLAIDLNLLRGETYLKHTAEYKTVGEFWLALHELCEWGGSDDRADGNHFSIGHEGRW